MGGGWLTIGGTRVDLLYRDMARVGDVIDDCRRGSIERQYQPGSPRAFVSTVYMGEVLLPPVAGPARPLGGTQKLTSPLPTGASGRNRRYVPAGGRIHHCCRKTWPWPQRPYLRRRLRLPMCGLSV